MNEAHDRLETELAALRPHDPSPELRRRIADHRAHSPHPGSRRRLALIIASGLVTACAAAILFHWGSGPRVEPERTIVLVPPEPPVDVEDSGPTRRAYQRALARSPEDLDALLDKDAMAAQKPNPELVRISASHRSDAELRALLGDN